MSLDSNKRVKVYKMVQVNGEGAWDDQGTGYVEFTILEPFDYPGILVKSEEESDPKKVLLKTKVSKEDVYVRQQDTLIVWNETNEDDPKDQDGTDLAISFQEAEGCQEFWLELREIQNSLTDEIDLPVPTINNLESIQLLFDRLNSAQARIITSTILSKQAFLATFFGLFKTLEEEGHEDQIKKGASIVKRLFMLNSKEMAEHLCDTYFNDILYLLDHEPGSKTNHTQFVKDQVNFVEVIKFNDENFEKKIHQTFRLFYLRDSVFGRVLDEQPLAVLGGMVHANCVQLVTHFFTSDLMKNLFLKMKTPDLPDNILLDCMKLLVELISYSASLATPNIILFFKSLISNGLFEAIQTTLVHPLNDIRKLSAVIVLNTIDFEPSILRCYLLERKNTGCPLFHLLITQFVQETHYITKTLLYEVLRGFLDMLHIGPDEATLNQINLNYYEIVNIKTEEEKTAIINIFYQEHAMTLFEPLFKEPPTTEHDPIDTLMINCLCDLLATFVDHHPQQTKVFIIKYNIMPKIFVQLKSVEKNLLLGPIRVLRRIVGSNNKFYHNYVIENNLFEPIIDTFLKNGDKYNALNSAILDIFHYIGSQKSCRPLVKYFIENFYVKVKDIDYVQTFQNLFILNDTPDYYVEGEDKFVNDTIREKSRQKFREEDKEESWFDSDDDFALSTNMLVEDLNTLHGDLDDYKKRKHDEEAEINIVIGPNVQDSPRPKRLKFNSSNGKDLF